MRRKQSSKHPIRRGFERVVVRSVTLLLAALTRALPLSWCRRIGNVGGLALYAFMPRRQRLADRSLALTFGDQFSAKERRRIRLGVAQNMCKVFLELFKSASMTPEQIREIIPLERADVVRKALERGKGCLLLSAHFGNWEMLGARIAAEGFDVGAVARDASDVGVASVINRSREAAGVKVVGKWELKAMMTHLRRNGALGILPDQHARRASLRLDFLGRPAWSVHSPAVLALRTGCAMVPVFCIREPDDSLRAYCLEEIEVEDSGNRDEATARITQRVNDVIGEQIRLHPEQWLWFHNRWKDAAPEHEERRRRAAEREAGGA